MKTTKIHKLEHSALVIEHNKRCIAVDTGCMTTPTTCAKMRGVDAVLVTHKHGDHFDAEVLRAIGAPVFGPPEVAALANAAGLAATTLELNKPVNIAGMEVLPVRPANHGPAVTTPLENYGFVLQAGNKRVYITSDMAGVQGPLPAGPFALVALPVEGGGFVFDGKEAAEFLRGMGHTGLALAVHADDAPAMREEFVKIAGAFCNPIALIFGETVEF